MHGYFPVVLVIKEAWVICRHCTHDNDIIFFLKYGHSPLKLFEWLKRLGEWIGDWIRERIFVTTVSNLPPNPMKLINIHDDLQLTEDLKMQSDESGSVKTWSVDYTECLKCVQPFRICLLPILNISSNFFSYYKRSSSTCNGNIRFSQLNIWHSLIK